MSKYAPARADGMKPYVVTTRMGMTSPSHRIEWADDLALARRAHENLGSGYIRSTVRRATPEDMHLAAGDSDD